MSTEEQSNAARELEVMQYMCEDLMAMGETKVSLEQLRTYIVEARERTEV